MTMIWAKPNAEACKCGCDVMYPYQTKKHLIVSWDKRDWPDLVQIDVPEGQFVPAFPRVKA